MTVRQVKLLELHPTCTRPVAQWQWVECHPHLYQRSIHQLQRIGVTLRWVMAIAFCASLSNFSTRFRPWPNLYNKTYYTQTINFALIEGYIFCIHWLILLRILESSLGPWGAFCKLLTWKQNKWSWQRCMYRVPYLYMILELF